MGSSSTPKKRTKSSDKGADQTTTPSLTPAPGNAIIIVSNDDIHDGYKGHPYLCPFARAAAKCIPGNRKIIVTRDEMRVFYGSDKGWKTYKLDRVVTDNIAEFDVMCVMKPFSWEFTL